MKQILSPVETLLTWVNLTRSRLRIAPPDQLDLLRPIPSLPFLIAPTCLLPQVKDGNTIATGHVDGTVCLWDVRQVCVGGNVPHTASCTA